MSLGPVEEGARFEAQKPNEILSYNMADLFDSGLISVIVRKQRAQSAKDRRIRTLPDRKYSNKYYLKLL